MTIMQPCDVLQKRSKVCQLYLTQNMENFYHYCTSYCSNIFLSSIYKGLTREKDKLEIEYEKLLTVNETLAADLELTIRLKKSIEEEQVSHQQLFYPSNPAVFFHKVIYQFSQYDIHLNFRKRY